MQGRQKIYPIYDNGQWLVVPVVSHVVVKSRNGKVIQKLKASEIEEAIATVDDLARLDRMVA